MPIVYRGPGSAVVDDKFYLIGGWTAVPAKPPSPNPMETEYTAFNEEYTPMGYGTPDPSVTLPEITVFSPENKTYNLSSVSLNFTVNKPASWIGYSLDGQGNVTINGNTTIAGLSNRLHNVTVFSNDTYDNAGASKTISFTVDEPAAFPTAIIITASGVSIAMVAVGILVYFKKRKR